MKWPPAPGVQIAYHKILESRPAIGGCIHSTRLPDIHTLNQGNRSSGGRENAINGKWRYSNERVKG